MMKKLLALLLALGMLLSFAACGGKDKAPAATDDGEIKENLDDIDDLKDLDEMLEMLKTEGWDENSYGMYIYDVWDSEFLPHVMPAAIDGVKLDQTTFKDYSHEVMNDNFSVGPIWYENKEDYRQYGVSFYATTAQYDEFLAAVEAKGFTGSEKGDREEYEWWEAVYYHEDGWFMYVTFRSTTYENDYDGLVSVSLTDSVFQRPEAVSGIPLPTQGMPEADYVRNGVYMLNEVNDEVAFDLAADTLPTEHHYALFFGYYGTDPAYAEEYAAVLASAGWTVTQESKEEGDYYALLEKDGRYAQVDYLPYDGILQVGFSSMVENLQY